ncbi:hypothetical protein M9458_054592 [Cirrhinus mrigala]|uniref:Uncharacterized protein n=1 Tax=Cirrhinus mrigala TaxID=683832 RepID=A0ABD0MMF6_CIRMR
MYDLNNVSGNSQYSQQQAQYQQSSGAHQTFSQQQYPSQAGYSAQPQGYGPGQGSSSQYPHSTRHTAPYSQDQPLSHRGPTLLSSIMFCKHPKPSPALKGILNA